MCAKYNSLLKINDGEIYPKCAKTTHTEKKARK